MNQGIETFSHEQFGSIRVAATDDGAEMFCAKDVAAALGYKNTNDAISKHCKGVAKRYPLSTPGGTQEFAFISEPDVFRLIASSKLPAAQRFEAWVFEEVLPSIRRTGGYVAARADETPEQIMARAVLVAQDTIERQKARIGELERDNAEMRPKALFADAVASSDGCVLVGQLAKMLRQAGVEIGQNRLFEWMRENGYLGKSGSNYNVPLQRFVEQGLFRVKETAVTHADGHVTLSLTTKVTGKGQRYFMDRFLAV